MTAPFFIHFGIQALSRTTYAKFQNIQAPNLFSRLPRALRNGKKIQELSRKNGHPVNCLTKQS